MRRFWRALCTNTYSYAYCRLWQIETKFPYIHANTHVHICERDIKNQNKTDEKQFLCIWMSLRDCKEGEERRAKMCNKHWTVKKKTSATHIHERQTRSLIRQMRYCEYRVRRTHNKLLAGAINRNEFLLISTYSKRELC